MKIAVLGAGGVGTALGSAEAVTSGEVMTNPGALPERGSVFLSGDDRDAKQITGQLLSEISA
ncbi:hypothetical protein AB0F72_01045 [Actinoplanes sp. NPDC023936]|uniref:hypothetical protein n=1 Tax=Actinoplanes sp. NPDC023936 TaxID=3154910 RepID=UPI0033C90E09